MILVPGAGFEHEKAGTIGAVDLLMLDAQPDAGMTEPAFPAIAGNDTGLHQDGLHRAELRGWGLRAKRHYVILTGFSGVRL